MSVSLVTLTTYPSASDESSAVQLTVIVVAVLLTSVRGGAVAGTTLHVYSREIILVAQNSGQLHYLLWLKYVFYQHHP